MSDTVVSVRINLAPHLDKLCCQVSDPLGTFDQSVWGPPLIGRFPISIIVISDSTYVEPSNHDIDKLFAGFQIPQQSVSHGSNAANSFLDRNAFQSQIHIMGTLNSTTTLTHCHFDRLLNLVTNSVRDAVVGEQRQSRPESE